MSIATEALKGIRLAGQGLARYATNPETLGALGKQIALDTALGTAVSQAIPRVTGNTPPPLAQTALNVGLHSALNAPISGGLQAMGVPKVVAQAAGQVAGTMGSHQLSRIITPEPNKQSQYQPQLAEFMQLQHMNAEMERQRYNNEINLALAKNFHSPTVITHRNPSADLQTIQALLNPRVQY